MATPIAFPASLHQLAEIAFAARQTDEALRHLRASIALSNEQGRIGDIALQLRLFARIEAAQSRPAQAVRLYAAASRLGAHASTMPPDDPAIHEREQQTLRETLGDRRYEGEWALGAAMSVGQAVKQAISSPSS